MTDKHKKGQQKAFDRDDAPDLDEEPVTEADYRTGGPNDPNDPNSPERKIQIDDNPEETQRKIPHANHK